MNVVRSLSSLLASSAALLARTPVLGTALRAASSSVTLATDDPSALALGPVAALSGIVRTAQDATTATTLAANTCKRGFWLVNHYDSGGVLWFAAAGSAAPTAAGANALDFVVPGDRKWIGAANTNAVRIIASAITTYYSASVE